MQPPPGSGVPQPTGVRPAQQLGALGLTLADSPSGTQISGVRTLAAVAHDLNNLLSIITAEADLLGRMLDGDSPAQARIAEVRDVAETSGRLVGQLSRLLAHRRPRPVATSLNEVVGCIRPVLHALIGGHVELVLHLETELRPALVSPVQVERILLNLAANARDAMPHGGSLAIWTENVDVTRGRSLAGGWLVRGAYVKLVIRDSGAGIPPAIISKVFQPGFSTKGSTGLGLATVAQIAEDCGGSVDVQGEGGPGASFEVYLPRCDERSAGPISLVVEK